MIIHFKPVGELIGITLAILGLLMFTAVPFSLYYQSHDEWPIIYSGLLNILIGIPIWFFCRNGNKNIRKREGYLIVTFGWLSMVCSGMTPYLISGVIPNVADAFFETVSGMTTTGATILRDIEAVPKGILYWRSLTQWVGGMGIIVLTVAIFPLLGIGGIELFVAEAPGPTSDKLHPRIRETAKRLWLIYLGLTAVLIILLLFGGMGFYDAINHSFTTMATGGFSTKNASIAYFESNYIEYVLALFMFIAGTNYTIIYFSLKGDFKSVWKSDEFKAYLFLIIFLIAVITYIIYVNTGASLEKSFRDSTFQIISIITTTGFITADYTLWSSGATMVIVILLFIGASAGSTSGGIKMIRHVVLIKNAYLEFKRLLHQRAIIPLIINGQLVRGKIITHIIIFTLLYLLVFVVGTITVSFMGLDFLTAVGSVATSLGNVGPGIGKVGPVDNFAWLSSEIKVFLAFLMLLGRLEIFTILVLFTPFFWKSN